MKRFAVIWDRGHGLDTSGKRTPLFLDCSFMRENEFNRDVVNRSYNLLEEYEEIDCYFTNTEKRDLADKKTGSLKIQVDRANDFYLKYKHLYEKVVLVSVHANAIKSYWNDIANGTATFHYPGNMVDKAFAEVIQRNLIAKTKLKPHRDGVVAADFQILREPLMPAVLCECAFMDNRKEAELLRTDEFRQACAEGIVNGLLEYFVINQKEEADEMVRYKKYNDSIHELRGSVKDLAIEIVDKKIGSITEFTNCVNGTYYWYNPDGTTYSTSILYANGKTYQGVANHYYNFGCPQSVFIRYKDNTVDLKVIYFLSELDLNKVDLVIGGLGLRNIFDSNFRYSPVSEGFKAGINKQGKWEDQSGVLRKTNHTILGYNKNTNKTYLLVIKNATMAEILKIISDNSFGEEFHIALKVDSGGSSFMDALWKYVVQGQDSRRIHNILRFI